MKKADFIKKQHEILSMIEKLSDDVLGSKDIGFNQKTWIEEQIDKIWSELFNLDVLKLE